MQVVHHPALVLLEPGYQGGGAEQENGDQDAARFQVGSALVRLPVDVLNSEPHGHHQRVLLQPAVGPYSGDAVQGTGPLVATRRGLAGLKVGPVTYKRLADGLVQCLSVRAGADDPVRSQQGNDPFFAHVHRSEEAGEVFGIDGKYQKSLEELV